MHTSLYQIENPPPSFRYEEAADTEIPRMAALAARLDANMRELQPMPDHVMDGLNDAHSAVVRSLIAAPIRKSSDVACKLRCLADLVEGDEAGVLVLEEPLLIAVLHDLGALRIRDAITYGFGWVEAVYGELLQLRGGEFSELDVAT